MANEIEQLNGITALEAIREAKMHLDMALEPYAMAIGRPVDYLDYGHVNSARVFLQRLLEANHGR
jgi:hypothetical protein